VRCGYCDFNTYAGAERWIPAYVSALRTEIRREAIRWPGATLETIYFGGGTPSLLPVEAVRELMDALRDGFEVAPAAEVSLEANPCSITAEKLAGWLDAGINRLSVGVQSLDGEALRFLDRRHDGSQALTALRAARRAGFGRLNADLIYGIPGLPLQRWMDTLEGVLAADPDHLSAYELTIEAGTPLARWVEAGRCHLPDPEEQLAQYWAAAGRLQAGGWEHYEISNWARPGAACRHNLTYWRGEAYLGLGAGAHGMRWVADGGIERYWNVRPIAGYIEAVSRRGSAEDGCERLDAERRAAEAAMLGVRLLHGMPDTVDLAVLAPVIDRLVLAGLLHPGPPPRLSRRGIELASAVGRALLGR